MNEGAAALPVTRVKASHRQVADQLMGSIVRGYLRPGDRLPSEEALAGRFGVGRPTVREALLSLEARDLVHPGRGPRGGRFVAEWCLSDVGDHLEMTLALLGENDSPRREDVLELSDGLEVLAASLAAQNRTEAQALTLRRGGGTADFHRMVASATHNPLLIMMVGLLRRMGVPDAGDVCAHVPVIEELAREHRHIAEAVSARDAKAAAAAMAAHHRSLEDLRQR